MITGGAGALNLDGTIDDYLRERLLLGELADSSARVIRPVLRQWVRHVDSVPPAEWTPELAAGWVHAGHLAASTRKSRLTKLRPWCRWLVDQGVLERDPTDRIARIIVPPGAPRDLTAQEVAQLLAVCPDGRSTLIVLLMAHIGLRCGDVARLRVEDLDVRRRSTWVRAKGGRGERTHQVPVPEEAWDALVSWIRAHVLRSGPVLRSYADPSRGLQPDTVGDLVADLFELAGLKEFPHDGRSPHALRHTCAQHMIDEGAELVEVQYTLGHKSIRSTELYTRNEPAGLREAISGRSYLRPAA